MKKLKILIILLTLSIIAYLSFAYFSNGYLPTFGIPLCNEKVQMRKTVLKFWEDIKFKDLKNAAKILPPNQDDLINIKNFLQRIFNSEAKILDVVSYKIKTLELDSTTKRARVKTKIIANNLQTGKKINRTVMLFFYRININNKSWFLELANSF